MQSSPPTRAYPRPSSRTESEYSLDLNALDMETQSDIDIPKQKVDRMFSEDIDGPSDFTQNMEMWMKGGTAGKGTMKGVNPTRTIQESVEDEDHVPRRESLEVPRPVVEHVEDERTESRHTPENSPPKVSRLDQTEHEDQFSSEWNTYDSASTPMPPPHKQFLQPTVEDYYSELSPARQPSAQFSRGRQPYASPSSTQKPSLSKEDHSTPGRASSPTLSPVRSPNLQRATSDQETVPDDSRHEIESQLERLSSKCQQLEHLNEALGHALDEDRRIRKEEKDAHDAKMAEAARRERDLAEMKEAAHRHNDGFRREFGELKEKLREQEKEAEAARMGSEGSERELRDELKRMRERMEKQSTQHKQATRDLEHDLELARRSRDDAEEILRNHRDMRDEDQEFHEAQMERLKVELQHAHENQADLADRERRLHDANAEIKQLKAASTEQEEALNAVRDQLAKAKQEHDDETTMITTDRSRAVELAAGLQRQLQDLRQQLKEEQTAHQSEIEKIKSDHQTAIQTSNQELGIVRTELASKQTELNEAILERDEAQDNLESHESNHGASKSEMEAMKAELANAKNELSNAEDELVDMKTVNEQLDARVTEKMQRRDRYWRDKLAEGDKERQLMAKALLHQWGREEVGIDSPQLYAYRYGDKENQSPGRSPTKGHKKSLSQGKVLP